MVQRTLAPFRQYNNRSYETEDTWVDLTIHGIPASLLRDFQRLVVLPNYPEGISDAIQDLMQKAINEKQSATAQMTQ